MYTDTQIFYTCNTEFHHFFMTQCLNSYKIVIKILGTHQISYSINGIHFYRHPPSKKKKKKTGEKKRDTNRSPSKKRTVAFLARSPPKHSFGRNANVAHGHDPCKLSVYRRFIEIDWISGNFSLLYAIKILQRSSPFLLCTRTCLPPAGHEGFTRNLLQVIGI